MKDKFEEVAGLLMDKGFFLEEAVELLERTLILRALNNTEGNRSAASKMLGIHRNTLQRKVDVYKLDGANGATKKPPQPVVRRARARKAAS